MRSTLRREIQQSKPFTSLEQEIFIALQVTARHVLDPFELFLKSEAGMSPAQYNVLRILRGTHPAGLPCSEISKRLIHRDPDITRMTDRLEQAGLVRRERGSADRRVVEVRITETGLSRLKELDPVVLTMPKKVLGQLGKRRLLQLLKLLADVRKVPSVKNIQFSKHNIRRK